MTVLRTHEMSVLNVETTVFSNAVVHTVDHAGTTAEALCVVGNRIAGVGTLDECRQTASRHSGGVVNEIDLRGRTVVPGFVDPHTHPLMYGQLLSWVDCSPAVATDIPSILARLANAAAAHPGVTPVRGYGYEHRNLAEGRHPTRDELDSVATDRELYLMNASGHGGVVNSFVLATNGINDATPNPPGGTFFRDAAGRLTGELSDSACDILTGEGGVKVRNHGPNFHLADTPEQHVRQLVHAQQIFLRNGVTTIGDAQVTRREFSAYLGIVARGELTMRVNAYFLSSLLDEVLDLGFVDKFGDSLLSFAGIKLYADGTLGGWTAYFPEGYTADPCRTGTLYHSPEEYRELLIQAHNAGLQTATHAQSPTAIQMVLDAVEAALMLSPRADHRHRIEHCGLPTPEQIDRMRRLEVLPVNQPQHYYNWGQGVIDAIGTPGERFNPLGEFIAAGVPVTMSSDAPVADPIPLEAMHAAVTRMTKAGVQLGSDAQKVSTAEALRGHTINGARALGRESELGSLEVGKFADFAILDRDPLARGSALMTGIAVDETWINGRRVFVREG